MKTAQCRLYFPDRIRVAFQLAPKSKNVVAQSVMKDEKDKSMFLNKP